MWYKTGRVIFRICKSDRSYCRRSDRGWGEAPKLLLKRQDKQVWIDNLQLGLDCDTAYLVKYPRGNYSELDCDI
ncbi:Uncharacterised protein [Actinobacillus equuli]|nr:Uncharacterised protein [Actinobacillus equuli]